MEQQIDSYILHLKKELEKIYPDMQTELPVDMTPDSVEKVKKIAAVASSNAMTIALYLRALSQYRKQKEADIAVEYIEQNKLKTPKDSYLKALYNKELAEVYSYEDLCQRMLDICKQRVMLAQTFMRSINTEDYTSSGVRLMGE